MNWSVIQRIVGLLLMMFSFTMLTPIIFSFIYNENNWDSFFISFLITVFSGLLIWLPARQAGNELRLRDGFIVVALFWVVLGLSLIHI